MINNNGEITPESWVVIKIENPKAQDPFLRTIYKVFASWRGGYLDGDMWKINSGIDRIVEDGQTVTFHGYSGSRYVCEKGHYGTGASYTNNVLKGFIEKANEAGATISILPEDTNWMDLV
jgi:hypothetical protein